ncbi:FimV/HubP family polar landmark protein [Arenimonas sp.]|uniref:FimV/HubP family polar landmark protein n=1 Tax=Arenimonas sp. TaxID=1872635 RepID=UPI002E315EAF|nr:FimV/HubP family polar landmark protein [Arenimonas sp.]HEX4852691.1 FimV/HubP family polar landmark protein [Arenimonas sp.]
MNKRHLQLPLALALALGASSAHALGLGPIQVKSGLNEPLVAEIPILSAAPGELDELEVRLASPEAFARVGLERPVGLTANLQMSVGRNAAGQPVILVTTASRFTEPFLTFLIEANWGRGSVVREYSALVDPPYIAPAVIRPLEAPVAAAPAPYVAPPPAPLPEPVETTPVADPEPVLTVTDIPPEAPAPAAEPLPPEPAPSPEPVLPEPEPEVAAQPADPAPAPVPEPAPEPAPEPVAAAPTPAPVAPPPPAPAPAAADSYGPVSEGQTLWSIANAARQDRAVTINQMMLALQRANPEAFIDDNINQLKRGAVLRIPAREEALQLGAEEAAALVREQASAWQARRQPVPQPAESVAEAPSRPAPRPGASAPADGRLEIVPPSGEEQAARGLQSGASGAGTGAELRAELTQAREDLAARQSEVAELRSQLTELDEQQADSERLVELQDSQLKALQERLGQPEPVAPAPAPEPTPAPAADTAAAEPAPAAPAPTPWYLNPLVLAGAGLVLLGGLVLALRGRRSKAPLPVPSRRISDDDAVRASLPGAARPGPAAAEPEPADEAASDVVVDENLQRLQKALRERPNDLEAHIGLLRYHYSRGEAAEYERAAQAMRIQVRSTLDPRWREAVVMGASLAPGNALFSQAGWNTPRFGDTGVMAATAKPASAAPPAPASAADLDDLGSIAPAAPAPAAPVDEDEDWARITSGGAGVRLTAPEPTPAPEPAFEPEPDFSAEPDFTAEFATDPAADGDDDGSATKIELAKAYLDIGDVEGAKGMLEEVLAEAGPAGRAEAARLLKDIG